MKKWKWLMMLTVSSMLLGGCAMGGASGTKTTQGIAALDDGNYAQAQQLLGGRLSACDHGEQGEHRGDGRAFACPERGVLDTEAGKQPASVHSVHGEIAAPGKRLRKRKVESERQRAPRGVVPRSAACRAATRTSGNTRMIGPASQNPTMHPSVFVIKSSTSKSLYGCS